jgi:PST family polysaccharide transporter
MSMVTAGIRLKPFDADGTFHVEAPSAQALRRHGIRGAAMSILSAGCGLAIQVVATLVLGRLLTPTDFGVVTMVTTFSLLLANFGTNGFPAALVQRKALDHRLASNIFWVVIGAHVGLAVFFAGSGSLLAAFFRDPRVTLVTAAVAVAILLNGTWVVHVALLQRGMRFSVVSANEVVARAMSVATSVLLAWRGYGYWALVAGVIAQPLSITVGAWCLCHWVPGLPQRARETGGMVRFATNMSGRRAVSYCTQNMDNLLVGWRFSARSLGLYKKAYDLFALSAAGLVSPLMMVAASTLSRLDAGSLQFRRYLLSAITLMAFIGMGLGAALTLIGTDMIRVLLGPGWEESGRIFTFFGPGIGAMLLYATHEWIHVSIGTSDRWFRWGIVEFVFTGLLFLIALPWGPVGIAAAWTASFWILAMPAFWYAGKPIGLAVQPIIAAVWRYPVASLLAGATVALVEQRASVLNLTGGGAAGAIIRIVAVSCLFIPLYIAAVILLHNGLEPLRLFQSVAQEIVPWGKISSRFQRRPAAGGSTGPVMRSRSEEDADTSSSAPCSAR